MSHRNHGKHRKGPSQMAIYGGRLKARNYSKFDSKLFKIFEAITDGYIGHTDSTDSTERGPSQMAGI